jgi:uncharacterized protein YndB with AHSA1/START domain
MPTITVIRIIHATPEVVFETIADARRFAQAISGDTRVEFLSENTFGKGARFRQSRSLNGKESAMEFEVIEFVNNERVRIVNETDGTVWDSVFTLTSLITSTTLTMRMEARTRRLVPRLLLPVMVPLFIRKAVEKDIDAIKSFCERSQI